MIIGICGYGYTGSSAIVDLLKEYEELDVLVKNFSYTFEFSLPYEPDGLLDLEYHLTKAPAKHLKSDMAIYRFMQLTSWQRNPMNRVTNGQFSSLTEDYLNSLIQVAYHCRRVDTRRNNRLQIYWEKGIGVLQRKLEKKLKRNVKIAKEDIRYVSVYPNDFLKLTREYVANILDAGKTEKETIRLIDQPFPPNNPEDVFHYFDDPYAIVVDRDPRDIYVMVKHFAFRSGRFIPSDRVEDFVEYYKAVRRHRPDKDQSRVLRIRFEDLIYEYDTTVKQVENFLNIEKHTHVRQFFKPEISMRNTQMMNLFPEDREAMTYIENHLSDYLYPFDKYEEVKEREGILDMAHW